jgi:hypothetical protein
MPKEFRNPNPFLAPVPHGRRQTPSRAFWAFPGLPNVPTDRCWLRASDFGILSAFGIRVCPIACFTEFLIHIAVDFDLGIILVKIANQLK